MVNIYRYWIEQGGFDGFRIDTIKHVDIGFWPQFNPAIRAHAAALGKTNFLQFGEVYDGADAKCGYYTVTGNPDGIPPVSVPETSVKMFISAFSWSDNQRTMTFHPAYPGHAAQQRPTITSFGLCR